MNKQIKIRINQYLKEHLGMYDYRRGWLKGDCPSCGDHKFGVNLGISRTNCFKCGYHPSPINLIIETEGLTTFGEAIRFIQGFEGLEYYEEKVEPHQLRKDVLLPEGYKNIRRGDNFMAIRARHYLKKRGFDIEKLSRAGWGYCDSGKYFGYIIMPFYMQGQLIYFNARRLMGDGPKFNNPPVEDFGLGKSMLIYNIDALAVYKTIYAVESVTNARTIGDNAIALGGKKISQWQKDTIIRSRCERVIIGLDDDGIDDAINLGLSLQQNKKIKIMQFPYKQDINDLGRKKSLKISHTTRYLNYSDLLLLKHSL